MTQKEKDDQILLVLRKLDQVYKTNFTTEGILEGYQNFEQTNMFSEALNMLIDAVAEGNMPEETQGSILGATVMMYAYARKNKVPSVAMVHEAFDKGDIK